jgi:hypothetical protein
MLEILLYLPDREVVKVEEMVGSKQVVRQLEVKLGEAVVKPSVEIAEEFFKTKRLQIQLISYQQQRMQRNLDGS